MTKNPGGALAATSLTSVLAAALVATIPAAAMADVTIGVIGPLTGPAANNGISMKTAYEVAAEQVNKDGGIEIDGEMQKIELIFEDSQSRPEVGVSAAQKLLTRDNVDILVGDTIHSSVTLAIMEIAPSFGKFMMSGQPVSIEIAKKIQDDPERFANVWKSSFNSDAYANTLFETVKYLIDNGKIDATDKEVAFLVEDTDYGKSNVEYTAPLFEEAGWTIPFDETVPLGYADFYPQLSKLGNNPPDVLISIFTSVNSGIALAKQIKEQQLGSLHVAVYYPIRPEFAEGAGEAAEGLLWTPLMFDPAHNEKHAAFAKMFEEATGGTEADGDSAQGYCQMTMLIDNIRRAGSVDPATLSETFATTDFTCPIARFVYNVDNHTPKIGGDYLPVPMAQIHDGVNFAIWPESVATTEFRPQH